MGTETAHKIIEISLSSNCVFNYPKPRHSLIEAFTLMLLMSLSRGSYNERNKDKLI